MGSSIVRGRYLISKVDRPTEPVVIANGAVFQRDGEIVEIGDYDVLARKYTPDEIIGSNEHVVMPGFVNAHHHFGVPAFQLGAVDCPLELWLPSRLALRDVDPYLDTLYSAFEMIESGITTVQHLHIIMRGPASLWPGVAQQVLKAYGDIGMRTSYGFCIKDQNRLVYGSDEEFVKQLPPTLGADVSTWLGGMVRDFREPLQELFVNLYESCGRNQAEQVRIWLAPVNLQWCSEDLLLAVKELSNKYRAGIHMNGLETFYQKLYARRRFGSSAVRRLYDMGFWGPNVTVGHGVWLSEEDIELLAESGTVVCHNASSNLHFWSGIAPLNHLMKLGVGAAIGIDETGINNDRDMLQEMRLILNLHRVPGIDQMGPSPAQVFQMATERGAHATGFGDRIGSLEPGRGADIVVMSLKNIMMPCLDPSVPILDAVIQCGRSADVDTVIIAGEVVLRNRRFTRVNKDEVLKELAASLKVPLRPDEIRRREMGRQLWPHVRRFYEDWIPERGDPYYIANQR